MTPACPVCPGVGRYLGALGNLAHFRCVSCGITFHERADEISAEDLLDDLDEAPESAGHYADHPEQDRDIRTSDYYRDET